MSKEDNSDLIKQLDYWMNRGDRAMVALDAAQDEVIRLRAVLQGLGEYQKCTCPHCGTHEVEMQRICHNSACKAYAVEETVHQGWKPGERICDLTYPAVKLTRDEEGMCEVSLEINGDWVSVLRDNGDFISHIVESIGVKEAVNIKKRKL